MLSARHVFNDLLPSWQMKEWIKISLLFFAEEENAKLENLRFYGIVVKIITNIAVVKKLEDGIELILRVILRLTLWLELLGNRWLTLGKWWLMLWLALI